MPDPLKKIVVIDPSAEVDSVTVQLSQGEAAGGLLLPNNLKVSVSLTSVDARRLYERFMIFVKLIAQNPEFLQRLCAQHEAHIKAGVQ